MLQHLSPERDRLRWVILQQLQESILPVLVRCHLNRGRILNSGDGIDAHRFALMVLMVLF
jgi:hypothetical protein